MYKKSMILFVNVKITNIRIHKLMGWNYRKCDWMPEDDRLNIFKYTLASYNELNSLFSKIYIFASLEDDFKDRKDEFLLFCKELNPIDIDGCNSTMSGLYVRELFAFQ